MNRDLLENYGGGWNSDKILIVYQLGQLETSHCRWTMFETINFVTNCNFHLHK